MRRPSWLVLIDCTTLPHPPHSRSMWGKGSYLPGATSHEQRCGSGYRIAHDARPTSGQTAAAANTAWNQQTLFFLQCIAGFLGREEGVQVTAEELDANALPQTSPPAKQATAELTLQPRTLCSEIRIIPSR